MDQTTSFPALGVILSTALQTIFLDALTMLQNAKDSIIQMGMLSPPLQLLIGFVLIFFGYTFVLTFVFFAGVAFGAWLFYSLAQALVASSASFSVLSGVAMLLGGLTFGILSIRAANFGIFIFGAIFGLLALSFFLDLYFPSAKQVLDLNSMMFYTVVAVISGLLAISLGPKLVIYCTAYIGSFIFTHGIGVYFGTFPDLSKLDPKDLSNGWVMMYIAIFCLSGLFGIAVQYNTSGVKSRYQQRRRFRRNTSSMYYSSI